ncbi:adenylate kinase family protein [Tundrisphaera lichenicola]|uniref:adenylate kinase family protein n=1 Tax=Tundrisphaera lichenicola TaxID=2029860 RepID=UPI003EBC49AA
MAPSVPPDHLVIFGRPGSGKSSLAESLGADFGYKLIRTGEMLRAAIRRQDFLGKRVEAHLAMGDLVPDALIFELLELNLKSPGSDRLLFDGFPRTMGQVPLLEQFEKRLGFEIECYLEIAVTREEAVARMTGRRVCPKCGATYHLIARPPRVAEVCDLDGTPLERRPDDTAEVVGFRQRVYDEHAIPILRHYQEKFPDLYRQVDGNQGLEAVYLETRRALGVRD